MGILERVGRGAAEVAAAAGAGGGGGGDAAASGACWDALACCFCGEGAEAEAARWLICAANALTSSSTCTE